MIRREHCFLFLPSFSLSLSLSLLVNVFTGDRCVSNIFLLTGRPAYICFFWSLPPPALSMSVIQPGCGKRERVPKTDRQKTTSKPGGLQCRRYFRPRAISASLFWSRLDRYAACLGRNPIYWRDMPAIVQSRYFSPFPLSLPRSRTV
ncbi:hypothetical protein LZ30DRAFT_405035 [Colletotrichum cereale]|nr:hypothetical protein LZ30DRAFT_405035 [Colletotrichum cereale]